MLISCVKSFASKIDVKCAFSKSNGRNGSVDAIGVLGCSVTASGNLFMT